MQEVLLVTRFFKDIDLNTPISICENGTLRTYI